MFPHPHPALAPDANALVGVRIPESADFEQLYVYRGVKDDEVLVGVCCIPFFLYGVGLRDICRLTAHELEVVRSSDSTVLRVFAPDPHRADLSGLVTDVASYTGVCAERIGNGILVAIDVPRGQDATPILQMVIRFVDERPGCEWECGRCGSNCPPSLDDLAW